MNYKVKRLVLFIFTLMATLLPSKISYCATVGDSVDTKLQVEIEGVKYPADGSSVVNIDVTAEGNELLYYDDGTAVMDVLTSFEVPVVDGPSHQSAANQASAWITHKEDIKVLVLDNTSGVKTGIEGGNFANLVNMEKLVLNGNFTMYQRIKSSSTYYTVGTFFNSTVLSDLYILKDLNDISDGQIYRSAYNSYMFEENTKLTNIYIGKDVTTGNLPLLQKLFGYIGTYPRAKDLRYFSMTAKDWTVTYEEGAAAISPSSLIDAQWENVETLTVNGGSNLTVSSNLKNLKSITFNGSNNSSFDSTNADVSVNYVGVDTINKLSAPTSNIVGIDDIKHINDGLYSLKSTTLDLSNVDSVPILYGLTSLTDLKLNETANLTVLKDNHFNNLNSVHLDLSDYSITSIGTSALNGVSVNLDFSGINEIKTKGLTNTKLDNPDVILNGDVTVGDKAFLGSNINSLVYSSSVAFNTNIVNGASGLTKLIILSNIDPTSNKTDIVPTAMVYCAADSSVETWCKNNSVAYKILTDEELQEIKVGVGPKLIADNKLFDFTNPKSISFIIDLGKKPAGASKISKVIVDNNVVSADYYTFNGTDTITLSIEYLKTLYNGTHSVSVLFDNGTFKSGASIYVMSSNIPVVDPTKPPAALDTIKYEFYKDYPDYLIIPVSLNGATKVTKLKIGSEIVDPEEYDLDEGAIVISYNYLSTLDAGKYRVMPTFDDPAITTLNNIQLYVYENAADRAAPYLLQTRILFKGQDFSLKFDAGLGDLETSNVLALVLDDKMILQDGSVLPFTTSNVKTTQKMAMLDLPVASPSEATPIVDTNDVIIENPIDEEPVVASPSEASPSEATMLTIQSSKVPLVNITDEPFYVNDNIIYVNGEFIDSMKLKDGDHFIGAIFDNTEKTTDIKKVILSIESIDTPIDPGTPTTPTNPTEPSNPVDPQYPDPDPSNGSSGGSGGSGSSGSSGGSGSGGSGSGGSKTGPGVISDKPVVPNDGGSYIVNPENPRDVTYLDKDGNKAPNKWVGDGKNWRHTNSESKLDYSWFKDTDDTWYMLDREVGKTFGAAKTGWYYETQDGYWYYLDANTTAMQVGWINHNGYWYYLSPNDIAPTYTGNNDIGWTYIGNTNLHPKGSMLYNAVTPDGYKVNENGQWIQ